VIDAQARIGRGVRLDRAVVGPGAQVGDGATVVSSVLWGGAQVGAGAHLRRCVVTDEAVVAEGDRLPLAGRAAAGTASALNWYDRTPWPPKRRRR
jgi:ADP-glucose pyrophosphorylase